MPHGVFQLNEPTKETVFPVSGLAVGVRATKETKREDVADKSHQCVGTVALKAIKSQNVGLRRGWHRLVIGGTRMVIAYPLPLVSLGFKRLS